MSREDTDFVFGDNCFELFSQAEKNIVTKIIKLYFMVYLSKLNVDLKKSIIHHSFPKANITTPDKIAIKAKPNIGFPPIKDRITVINFNTKIINPPKIKYHPSCFFCISLILYENLAFTNT